MDAKLLLLKEWTTVPEYNSSKRVKVKRIEKDKDEKKIIGKLKKGSGHNYDPTLNWETGEVSCGCGDSGKVGMLLCRHLIALFDSLCAKVRTEKYAEMFLEALDNKTEYVSYKTTSDKMPSGCNRIDKLLKGGFRKSVVTSIAGPTKVGKSFLCSQTAIYNALLGKNILYIDTESYFLDDEAFPAMVSYFRKRWEDLSEENDEISVDFLFPKNMKEFANYLGLNVYPTTKGKKVVPTIHDTVSRGDVAPLYGICKEKDIDMVIIDSFTAIFKKAMVVSRQQSAPGRADMINKLYSRLEDVAKDLGVAVLITNHASRNYDFEVEDVLTAKQEQGGGIWGGYSFMYNVKYLIQIEYATEDQSKDYKNRMVRYVIRRLWPAVYPRYVVTEIRKDFGYVDFEPEAPYDTY